MFARSLRATFSRRRFSTDAPGLAPPKLPSPFQRLKKLMSENRQAFLNVLAVWFTMYCCIHNRRVSKAWEEKQKEFDALDGRYKSLAAAVIDKEWIKSVESKVKSSKESVLEGLITSRLEEVGVTALEQASQGEVKVEAVPGSINVDGSGKKREII